LGAPRAAGCAAAEWTAEEETRYAELHAAAVAAAEARRAAMAGEKIASTYASEKAIRVAARPAE
jgi:hypothetical protein